MQIDGVLHIIPWVKLSCRKFIGTTNVHGPSDLFFTGSLIQTITRVMADRVGCTKMCKKEKSAHTDGSFHVLVFDDLGTLPDNFGRLFELAGEESFFQSRHWYKLLSDSIATKDDKVRIYAVASGDKAQSAKAAIILKETKIGSNPLRPRVLKSYTNYFSYSYAPICSSTSGPPDNYIPHLVAAIWADRARWDILQIEAIRMPSPLFDCLVQQLRAQGLWVRPYFQHGVWYQNVEGLSSKGYLATKSKNFRQVINRKERRLAREYQSAVKIVTSQDDIDEAIRDYVKVYRKSWKEREEYEDFVPALLRVLAALGKLRLGLLYINNEPVATQLTILSGESGIMYKTAYDPTYANLSVGNIIMLNVIRHVLDIDHVCELDFGIGDDEYKSHWLSDRRENWGLMAFNPRSAKGILGAARHLLAPALVGQFTNSGSAQLPTTRAESGG